MPGVSLLKKERKLRLTGNTSTSRKIVNSVTKQTHKLQSDLISGIDRPTGNEHFTYKERPFAGPSCRKLSNFLEQRNTDILEKHGSRMEVFIEKSVKIHSFCENLDIFGKRALRCIFLCKNLNFDFFSKN
jgi:hypothetical protein